MKKNYMQPEIKEFYIRTSFTLMAGSGTLNMNSDPEDAVGADEVLSRKNVFSFWDEDEE